MLGLGGGVQFTERDGLAGASEYWERGKGPRSKLQGALIALWGTTSGLKCAGSFGSLTFHGSLPAVRDESDPE